MDIRSTLLINKSGIHIKNFEEKFKDLIGEPLPLRLLGYHSVLQMAENMSDVINMIRLYNGAIVLQAVPDKSTREHWNEIQSQKGRIGTMDDVSKLGIVGKIRKTPEFLKKTVRDLVADKEITEEGLSFVDFKDFYWMVTGGESLDVDELGYCGMKDLFRNGGMDDIVDLKWDSCNQEWKIVPVRKFTVISKSSHETNMTRALKNIILRKLINSL